jgi:hypothetical protein
MVGQMVINSKSLLAARYKRSVKEDGRSEFISSRVKPPIMGEEYCTHFLDLGNFEILNSLM